MLEIENVEKSYGDFEQLDKQELLRPSKYFDLIVGTSTGGSVSRYLNVESLLTISRLIAIMLGRLRMSVEECIDQYEKLASKIFGKPRHFHARAGFFFWDRPKFNTQSYRDIIRKVVQTNRDKRFVSPDGSGSWNTFAQPRPESGPYLGCKTSVVNVIVITNLADIGQGRGCIPRPCWLKHWLGFWPISLPIVRSPRTQKLGIVTAKRLNRSAQ
jgi:Patatin-like phospholipase